MSIGVAPDRSRKALHYCAFELSSVLWARAILYVKFQYFVSR